MLIPGMLNDAGVWSKVAPRLASDAEVRMADVTTQDSIEAMAQETWDALGTVPPDQPLVLAGFSMGGYVLGQMLAVARRPVAAVAMIDSSAKPETPESLAMREKVIAAMGRNFERLTENFLGFNTHPDNHGDAALMAEVLAGMRRVGATTGIRQNRAIAARPDHRPVLSRLAVPAVVVCGRADQVTPPECSEDLARLIPAARLVWVEGAGHMTLLEQPQAVAQALRELLAQLPASPQPSTGSASQ